MNMAKTMIPQGEYDRLAEDNKRLREAARWIPISERVPVALDLFEQPSEWYLVQVVDADGERYHYLAYRKTNAWYEKVTHAQILKVTHWMPLPEPPQEGTTAT